VGCGGAWVAGVMGVGGAWAASARLMRHTSHVRRLPQPGEEREVRGSDHGGVLFSGLLELRN